VAANAQIELMKTQHDHVLPSHVTISIATSTNCLFLDASSCHDPQLWYIFSVHPLLESFIRRCARRVSKRLTSFAS
jgi:hypothetical protein